MSKDNIYSFIMKAESARLDLALIENLNKIRPDISRQQLKRIAAKGLILLNDKQVKLSARVSVGDEIRIILEKKEEQDEIKARDIKLDIVYEDDSLLVINKPRGLVVHPGADHKQDTIVNGLLYRYGSILPVIKGDDRPGIVHRIDKDTSGLLVCAKTNEAAIALGKQLDDHTMTRKYLAILHGNLKVSEGTIDKPLIRGSKDRTKYFIAEAGCGRRAVTHYKLIKNIGDYAFVECRLETGRTHQIRVHMKSIGHPIVGDRVYAFGGQAKGFAAAYDKQLLHAASLGFVHPISNKYMEWQAELPDDMKEFLFKFDGDIALRINSR